MTTQPENHKLFVPKQAVNLPAIKESSSEKFGGDFFCDSIRKSYRVIPCQLRYIRRLIINWHYSKNVNGVIADYCFALVCGEKLLGGMILGRLAMANQWKEYAEKPEDIIELRRLACINNTNKNAESFFIGKAIKWLKKNTNIKFIISYADPEYGHGGTIYKAANFKYLGQTASGRVIIHNGKKYHDKAIRAKHSGVLKPFAIKLKTALDMGDAQYKSTCGKHIFIYDLKGPSPNLFPLAAYGKIEDKGTQDQTGSRGILA